ncbi:Protein of unknown function [Rhizobium mongolense subsp. loessense]|uniref:DUF2934 family protein n=1 Tax=Rhizobium mongolense subsp. loessense TaxID=158890 RepID=A0A1G4QL47_9HYPH|nr:DUF2934 domain-containing protein [Rhizobium mongolense]SCW45187.1 Protein of unknown function [Rhizobium mongolense subsp. loessense]
MTETREEWIKKRAYALWEEEGHPTGRDSIHWEQAKKEREKLESSAASKDGKEVKTRGKRTAPPGTKSTAPPATKSNGAAKPAAPKRAVSRKSV